MRHHHHHDHHDGDTVGTRRHPRSWHGEGRVERHAHRHGGGRHHDWDFGGRRFDSGHRAGRGDVRAAVLALLAEEPMHGYQIIQELAERSGGAWTPSPGSVYPALQLLQDQGLVTATESEGKRVFSLTPSGREAADGRGEGPLPWEAAARGARGGFSQLRELLGQVMAATKQVASAGTEVQVERAAEVLRGTRRELYRILAEDETENAES
ncbi:MAG TPA: PadR family transcriptional regulator [Mycobacteriales bacterium]|nr:PadR family transcriptional regulator [Mycobacteriales bacterium]